MFVVLNGPFRGIFVPPICTGGNRVCIELMTTVFGPTSPVGVDGTCLGIRRRKIISISKFLAQDNDFPAFRLVP